MTKAKHPEYTITLSVPGIKPTVSYRIIPYNAIDKAAILWLTTSIKCDQTGGFQHLGLDTEFDGARLGLLQLATSSRILLITFPPKGAIKRNELLETAILANPSIRKTGAELWRDSLLLYINGGHRLRGGYDLTRIYNDYNQEIPDKDVAGLFQIFSELYLQGQTLRKDRETTLSIWVGSLLTQRQILYAVLDGWVSYMCGAKASAALRTKPSLDLRNVPVATLERWGSFCAVYLQREEMQARNYISHFSNFTVLKDGNIAVVNSEFRNKLNANDEVKLLLSNDSRRIVHGTVLHGKAGKTKKLKPTPPLRKGIDKLERITVIEAAAPRAEDEFRRDLYASGILHGLHVSTDCRFFCALFAPSGKIQRVQKYVSDADRRQYNLNPSQVLALEGILYGSEPISLIHGPPGTGKSLTISAAVHLDLSSRPSGDMGIFVLTAQTNAATKNLADALFKRGVEDFRILVSDNYYVEWHEDQYLHLLEHVICTSDLNKPDKVWNVFGPQTVILCSLAQLSSRHMIPIFQLRRIRHLIMDEASQVFVGDLPHVFRLYASTLKRVTFVGDPNQLAPYGSDTIEKVQSVFDLHQDAILLNVQYRMPPDIGQFLSEAVYGRRLLSQTRPPRYRSVTIVDVRGKENVYIGGIKNDKEADTVVKLLTCQLLAHASDLLVITPYNKQRELIVQKLWSCVGKSMSRKPIAALCEKIRTIDTVQGQEAHVIILSLVRTDGKGFLNNFRRVNVALSRVKTKLVVVGHMDFFRSGQGKETLMGQFLKKFSRPERAETLQQADVRNGKIIRCEVRRA